jgi:hypothetical protein
MGLVEAGSFRCKNDGHKCDKINTSPLFLRGQGARRFQAASAFNKTNWVFRFAGGYKQNRQLKDIKTVRNER